jgi:hypothetical protein
VTSPVSVAGPSLDPSKDGRWPGSPGHAFIASGGAALSKTGSGEQQKDVNG